MRIADGVGSVCKKIQALNMAIEMSAYALLLPSDACEVHARRARGWNVEAGGNRRPKLTTPL